MSLNIWNNIDEIALYLGLDRLDGETNSEFVNRIKQFARWKYKTDYYTQVHSIPLQTGLNTEIIGRITSSGNNYECFIDWDYFTLKEILPDNSTGESIRVFIGNKDCKLSKIADVVNSSESFLFEVYNNQDLDLSIDYIVRNKNTRIVTSIISGKYSYFDNNNIVRGSIRIDNPSYRKEVYSIQDLKRTGEFYIDYKLGFIQTYDFEPTDAKVTYSFYDKAFAIEKTELALTPFNNYLTYGITDKTISLLPDLLNKLVAKE